MNRRTLIIAAAAATYQAVEDSIKASGTIKNLKSLERAARKRDLSSHFEPGRYVIEPGMSNQYIIRMIANGWQTPAKVTLRGYIKTLDRSRPSTGWQHSSAATSRPTPPHSPPP